LVTEINGREHVVNPRTLAIDIDTVIGLDAIALAQTMDQHIEVVVERGE
jgi:hypothetical protein